LPSVLSWGRAFGPHRGLHSGSHSRKVVDEIGHADPAQWLLDFASSRSQALRRFDNRKIVRITTHIRIADDPNAIRAAPIVQQINRDLEADWLALAAGEKPRERQRYDEALLISRGLGFGYSPTAELMTRPMEELVRRVEVLIGRRSVDAPEEVSAVLGGEDRPALRVSELKDEYEALQRAALAQMSPDQRRKWRNQRKRAVENFQDALGADKLLTDLTKADGLTFRKWWQDRVVEVM
jgi:hypothetical protein